MTVRPLSQKQIDTVLKLDGSERYDHFIKHVVDPQRAWGFGMKVGQGVPTKVGDRLFQSGPHANMLCYAPWKRGLDMNAQKSLWLTSSMGCCRNCSMTEYIQVCFGRQRETQFFQRFLN
jgi:hypothetical protein